MLHTVHRAGIRHIQGKINFPSRSTQMKNDPYHSWKAPCSFRVATRYIQEFRTRRMPVLIRGSRWLHRRNTVPSKSGTDHFSSVYSGTENCADLIFITDIPVRQGSRRMPAQCIHGDAGDNTDDPGAMTRDDPCCDP